MVSVIIRDSGESNVTQYTFEKLYTELKDIPGSELLIKGWDVKDIKNKYVCFVEADCLVSEGYFKKQLEVFSKLSPRVIMLSSATAVKYWDNRIYGYYLSFDWVLPQRLPKSNIPYPVQIAYIPGTIIRTSSLKKLSKGAFGSLDNLIHYSSKISLTSWQNGLTFDDKHPDGQLGSQININPNVVYATTEDYVNDLISYDEPLQDKVSKLFEKESI